MKYAIIGAGCGGQTFSGDLAARGYDVTLYNRSRERLGDLPDNPVISLEGAIAGKGRLRAATTDIREAVDDADIIMVATTALGHRDVARNMAPYLKDGQIIVLNPSRTFGSLEVAKEICDANPDVNPIICEANTLLYATRVPQPGQAVVHGVKDEVKVAALRPEYTALAVSRLKEAFPQMKPAQNILETSIGNIGAVFHPTITLLNADRIQGPDSFEFYIDGVTPPVAAYMCAVDQERQKLAHALGTEVPSIEQWLVGRYALEGKNLRDIIRSNPAYLGIFAPNTLDHRYLLEDVPTGLVPLSMAAKCLGQKTHS
ncbi:MAG: NAD/NADP octopine/nopaline dehydrogenase family protein, partial [Candidatus Nanoarchaeia archaeon]